MFRMKEKQTFQTLPGGSVRCYRGSVGRVAGLITTSTVSPSSSFSGPYPREIKTCLEKELVIGKLLIIAKILTQHRYLHLNKC